MKPINFTKSVSLNHHIALHRWFFFSTALVLATILALTILQIQQWHYARSLSHEKQLLAQQLKMLDGLLADKQKQLGKKELLHAQLLKITEQSKQPKNPAPFLKKIKTALKNNAALESFSLSEHHLELRISAESTGSLVKIANTLSHEKSYDGICVTSFEHKEQNKMIAVLKAQQMG